MENCVAPGLDKMWYIIRSRPNIRQEFALKLRKTQKPSNAPSLDSSVPYENLIQLETFFVSEILDWLSLHVLCVDQSVMLF